MIKGKLIVIEGTDCSGKETQSRLLEKKFNENGIKVKRYSFPMYESPTGFIVGGPYLGKTEILEGVFKEGASNVDPKVASLYFAADRKYNIAQIEDELNSGINIIMDRYVESNMAHQGSKLKTETEKIELFKWLEELEYNLLQLPKPDIKIFLHLPYKYGEILRNNRKELDQHEKEKEHLINAENTYLLLSDLYNYVVIKCYENESIRSIDDINNELYLKINDFLKRGE